MAMKDLSREDFLSFAIEIEETGRLFYEQLAVHFGLSEISDLFRHLSVQEQSHKERFKRMLEDFTELKSLVPTRENLLFVQNITRRFHFDSGKLKKEISMITTESEALKFASRRELDSIVYYYEMKNVFDTDVHQVIDAVIEEERQHYNTLCALITKREEKE